MSGTKKGTLINLQKEKGYGFIRPEDVGENKENIFFHFNNVVKGQDLSALAVGDRVEYFEEDAPRGKQAYGVVITFHIDFVK